MRIDVVTIFPELFDVPLSTSMLGIARDRGLVDVRAHDLRDWAEGVHRQTDDYSYGGGPGMVMKPEPFFRAMADLRAEEPAPYVVLLSPQGRTLDQAVVEDLAGRERLALLCGRYEGFDERVRTLADVQLSIGDYVVTGGELPALVLIDAVSRLVPGVLGHDDSASEESFSWGMLEYPQYTRPPQYEGMKVPDILLSGDHAKIRAWRRREAIRRTALVRPDLLESADLSAEEREYADGVIRDALDKDSGEEPAS